MADFTEKREDNKPAKIIWMFARPLTVGVCALIVTFGVLFTAWNYINSHYLMPVDRDDRATQSVVIKKNTSVSGIAAQLFEQGLIRNKGVFQYTAEFTGNGPKLKAGEYELSKSMTISEMIDILAAGGPHVQVMTIRITEGMNVEEIAASLVKQGALKSSTRFISLCSAGEAFATHPLVKELLEGPKADVRYLLEGYLFPDTYEIYVDSTEEMIITKLLDRSYDIYNLYLYAEAAAQDRGMRDIFALASMIEKEAKAKDFDKVSAIFLNRLDADMRLESDVTLKYGTHITRMALTDDDIKLDNAYNTYVHKGLPPGPVSNPGRAALEAALNPDQTFVDEKYLYFCSTDPESGDLVFSKTLKEHQAAVSEYRPLWVESDQKQRGAAGQ